MHRDLEDAIVEVERIKSEVAMFIENRLPNMTVDSDATEIIIKIMQGLVLIADGAVDALIVTEKAYQIMRERMTDEGGEASS